MNSNMDVMAHFVLFDTGHVTNVALVGTGPEVTSIFIDSYPVEDLSNVPSDIDVKSAYLINPAGDGNVILLFADISDAGNTVVYKVTDADWIQIDDIAINGNDIELTMGTGDPIIALCSPSDQTGAAVEPASFVVSDLKIHPKQVYPGQQVKISVNITNDGGETGNYKVILLISGQQKIKRVKNIASSSTRKVVFPIIRSAPGTYNVSIGEQRGRFVVVDQVVDEQDSASGPDIFKIIIAVLSVIFVVVLIVLIVNLLKNRV